LNQSQGICSIQENDHSNKENHILDPCIALQPLPPGNLHPMLWYGCEDFLEKMCPVPQKVERAL
jgi:hypothetical protein